MSKDKKQQFEGLKLGAEFSPFEALEKAMQNQQETPKEDAKPHIATPKAPKLKEEPKEATKDINVKMPLADASILKLVAMYEGKKIKDLVKDALNEYYSNPKHKKVYEEALKNYKDFLE